MTFSYLSFLFIFCVKIYISKLWNQHIWPLNFVYYFFRSDSVKQLLPEANSAALLVWKWFSSSLRLSNFPFSNAGGSEWWRWCMYLFSKRFSVLSMSSAFLSLFTIKAEVKLRIQYFMLFLGATIIWYIRVRLWR